MKANIALPKNMKELDNLIYELPEWWNSQKRATEKILRGVYNWSATYSVILI